LLIANGLIRVLEKSVAIDRGENTGWNEKLMQLNGGLVKSISVHSLVGGGIDAAADPVETWADMVAFIENYPDFLQKLVVEPMQKAKVEPHIAITELMDWARPVKVGNVTSISGALWFSGIMNTCIRSKGLINLVTRTALMNHGGGLRKDRCVIYTEPVYWSHFMYSSQDGTIPLEVKTTTPTFNSTGKYVIKKENMPLVDASALMTENGDMTSVFICNRDAKLAQEVELFIEGFKTGTEGDCMMIQCNDLALRNKWDKPERIAPVFSKINVQNNRITATLPPLSLVRIVVKASK
jgi:alpha-N-arabinofuranosidase